MNFLKTLMKKVLFLPGIRIFTKIIYRILKYFTKAFSPFFEEGEREVLIQKKNIENIFFNKLGHERSIQEKASVDRKGEPIPWYTYPAIEFLSEFDFSDKSIFEYGAGNSTLFWSRNAKLVHAVEQDAVWYKTMVSNRKENLSITLQSDPEKYVGSISGIYDV